MCNFSQEIKLIYTFNFTTDTTKEVNYHMSDEVQAFLKKAVKLVKKSDMGIYD
jgi:hypothetical protein